MNKLKLFKKRQRKESKRIIKRKVIRKHLNLWNDLGKERQRIALERKRRTENINIALQNLDNIVKRWKDKISVELESRLNQCKENLSIARKTKNLSLIDKAIKDFVPIYEEIIKIVEANEKGL